MGQKPKPFPKAKYIDRPEVTETFVDLIGFTTFDGNTVRAELCVRRFDEPRDPPNPAGPTSRSYPVARLVLTAEAAVDLSNRLRGFIEVMKQKGLVHEQPTKAPDSVN